MSRLASPTNALNCRNSSDSEIGTSMTLKSSG
jgi:hypothetical protein